MSERVDMAEGEMTNVNDITCPKWMADDELPCKHYIVDKDGCAGYCSLPSMFRCTEAIRNKAIRLSHSAVQSYCTCRMKFWYQYVMGITPRYAHINNAMKMGTLWDVCQGVAYGTQDERDIEATARKLEMYPDGIAKVLGVYEAYRELIDPVRDGFVTMQEHLEYEGYDSVAGDYVIHGYTDRSYDTYFVDNKFTGRPDHYTIDPFKIASQVGTYFMCDDRFKRVVMEVVRTPQLRLKKGEDDMVDYQDRIRDDVLMRPSHYFIGFDRDARTYGVAFYRSDFEAYMKDMRKRYGWITRDIMAATKNNTWYGTESACMAFGSECEFYPICRSGEGYVSHRLYTMRDKAIEKPQDEGEANED